MNEFTKLDLQKLRLYNNGLIDKFKNVDDCVKSLIGIQCQYQVYALISIYNRMGIEYNIFLDENLIKSWGQRTTLHIYHKSDYNLVSDTYCEIDNWVYKYFKLLKIDYQKYLAPIITFLNDNDNCMIEKSKIQSMIPNYKSKEVMEWSGLLILATYHKILYGILNVEDKKIYVKADINNNSNKAISNFIYRYFKFYGPATIQDFLHWSGLKYKNIRQYLDEYICKAKYFWINNKKYYYENLPDIKETKIDYPIILGKFDPLLISYDDKEWILNGIDKSFIWKPAGQVEGVILFSKGLKGTWHYKIKKNKIIFEVKEINCFTKIERGKLEKKFADLGKNIFDKEIMVIYRGGNL